MPEKALKTFQNTLLYSEKAVSPKNDSENNNELEKLTRNDRDFLSIYFGC